MPCATVAPGWRTLGTVADIDAQVVALPEPRRSGTLALEDAIATRRSRRGYSSQPLTLAELGQLLWAAQGVTGPERQRTAPSAGALYPLALYVAASRVEDLPAGIYRYNPESQSLELIAAGDRRRDLAAAAVWQDCMRFASCVLLFAADYARTTGKYGERGMRYVHIEVGAATQNVYLQAPALGLGTVIVGSFDDAQVASIAHLPEDESPICMMALGRL